MDVAMIYGVGRFLLSGIVGYLVLAMHGYAATSHKLRTASPRAVTINRVGACHSPLSVEWTGV